MSGLRDFPAGIVRWAASAAVSAAYAPMIFRAALFSRLAAYRLSQHL
jgi:hypothetical protein